MSTICHFVLPSTIIEKAFDSKAFESHFEGLKNQGVDEAYLNILRNLYSEETSVLRLHKDSEKFKLGKGARQGDDIPPKLFMSCLQHAIISCRYDSQVIQVKCINNKCQYNIFENTNLIPCDIGENFH